MKNSALLYHPVSELSHFKVFFHQVWFVFFHLCKEYRIRYIESKKDLLGHSENPTLDERHRFITYHKKEKIYKINKLQVGKTIRVLHNSILIGTRYVIKYIMSYYSIGLEKLSQIKARKYILLPISIKSVRMHNIILSTTRR